MDSALSEKKIPSVSEILDNLDAAFAQEQFCVYYQPQYSHSTGLLLGAEALVRWNFPGYGLVNPGCFIPLLEEKDLISRLDLYVFRTVCRFLKAAQEAHLPKIPISVNVSRCDILHSGFIDQMEKIRAEYGVSVLQLPLELTESAVLGTPEIIIPFVEKLHSLGYRIEMDDFGSGYSSLNVLKDVDFDLIKLDMQFLHGDLSGGRGGTIVSSVVRMARWLGLPVIAEGVETVEQADFMRSIGCDYIQGYLYSPPIPQEEFFSILSGSRISAIVPQMSLIETLDAGAFWSPKSQETLIFNNYVGGASIFEYKNGKTEILRVNQKYLKELGMNLSEKDLTASDTLDFLSESDKVLYCDMLELAIRSGEEQECETLWNIHSACCGDEHLFIRSTVRMIGKSDDSALFYASIRNITAEKNRFNDLLVSEHRFKMASEQVNIYYWEYIVSTKEMRPCFRCMRDLGLPALVTNYPEPAIEMGIFPPDYADMYRDWHRQIAEGVEHLEAVIPLTVGRVPFLVRYTTEFDQTGQPVKAYGSAALVIDK